MKRLMLLRFLMLGSLAFSTTNGVASNKMMSEGKGTKAILDAEKLQLLEASIIEDYLKQHTIQIHEKPQVVRIYDVEGQLVYEGTSETEEVKGQLKNAELLTETKDFSIYLKE